MQRVLSSTRSRKLACLKSRVKSNVHEKLVKFDITLRTGSKRSFRIKYAALPVAYENT